MGDIICSNCNGTGQWHKPEEVVSNCPECDGTGKVKKEQTIEIGCPPGNPRPGDLLPGVLKDTGIPVKESASRCFGDWGWDYSEISSQVWDAANPIIEKRLSELYNKGVIRYASW